MLGYEPPPYRYKVRPAAVKRVGLVAIDVLEQAFTIANREPLEPDVLHRLALGYLMLTGCCSPRTIDQLWKILRHEGMFEQMSCRQSHFGTLVQGIRERVSKLAV